MQANVIQALYHACERLSILSYIRVAGHYVHRDRKIIEMDDRDRLKITRNLSALKERVGADLDPILDKLIERDVFDIRIKVRISTDH